MRATVDELRRNLDYNPDTGIITWKIARSKMKSGSVAGYVQHRGYLQIKFNNVAYTAQIIAWVLYNGEYPNGEMDHINGIRTDNRICNLRAVTKRENQQNMIYHRNGKLVGSCFIKSSGKWKSRIVIKGKIVELGIFNTEEEASAAYFAKARTL